MEAMKMEHVLTAPVSGTVRQIAGGAGRHPARGPAGCWSSSEGAVSRRRDRRRRRNTTSTASAPTLQKALDRHAYGLDENRPEAVAKRHERGQRTARENIADLVDPGSFLEYGALVLAAQRRRRSIQD